MATSWLQRRAEGGDDRAWIEMSRATPQAVREEATTWFVRSQSADFGAADWQALHAWLAADPIHGEAYDEVEALWVELEDADTAPAPAEEVIVPFARPSRSRGPSRTWLAVGAALAACLAVAVMVELRTSPKPALPAAPAAQIYASLPGEQKAVTLADGTQVILNGDTRFEVALGGAARHVTMSKGEAIFDVTHDPARPFLIALGDRQVRVIGTQFDIVRLSTKLAVTVKRGVVAVEPAQGGGKSHRLTAGQQLVYKPGGASSTVRTVDPDQAMAWRSGRLSYTDTPLSDVGDDLGRYLGKPVQVDTDIAAMPFTGVLNMDSEVKILRRLETFLPVHAEASATGIRLSRARGR